MSKSRIKDSKYILIGYVVIALIILENLVSSFNIYSLFYLIAITIFVIRYFFAISVKK